MFQARTQCRQGLCARQPPKKRAALPVCVLYGDYAPNKQVIGWMSVKGMSFSSFAGRTAARLFALALAAVVSIPTYAADLKQNPKLAPGLPANSHPSGSAAVEKLMNPQLADPSVPLQTPNLSDKIDAEQPVQKPQIYGRAEQGGQNGSVVEGLVGVRIPFPAASSSGSADKPYSSGDRASGVPIGGR